jgi:alpha-L-arabinofuranosidase
MKRWFIVPLAVLSLTSPGLAEPLTLTVHTNQTTKTISTGIYGQFLEHIFNSVHGGLWGDQILNGTLELRPARGSRGQGGATPGAVAQTPTPPRNWEFVGAAGEVTMDRDNPFNAEVSVRIASKTGSSENAPGIRQLNIALLQGEMYTFTLYARGNGSVVATFQDGTASVFTKTFTGLTADWQKYTVDFTASRTVDAATLTIGGSSTGTINVDQISLFSASAQAIGGYRPDLFKAVNDLQPASIRWPGGSFANRYIWQNAVGPREKRLPHPSEQWGDRDTYQFGTDEFIQFCEKVNAEPILVLNTSRGVEDALNWLEYCMGNENTTYGKQRAVNGHPAPYVLKTIEIDNEPWLMMEYPAYLERVKSFCTAIRAKYPNLKLSVAGSYGYDSGPGEGNAEANRNWDPRIVADAGKLFDILSPHYYNGIYFTSDYVEDPYNYEQFLKGRGDIIRKSGNPNIRIYVSEWNLTNSEWGNDWRVGLYAGGILNAFERQGDMVTMSCPALFMRKQGVTTEWDNALINFDQKSWFPAGNYVVMKLWRDSFAPNLLAVEGTERPLNFVATRSADKESIFLKAVNPTKNPIEATIRLDGDFAAKAATIKLVAPGGETVKNSLDKPDNIKAAAGTATVNKDTVRFTMPPLSAGVVHVFSRVHNALTDQEKKDGWRLLWDGKTTEGWRSPKSEAFPAKGWMIDDGELIVETSGNGESQAGGDIITKERFSDFELMVDFKPSPTCNSGIKYFVQPNLDPITGTGAKAVTGSAIGLEFQILDDTTHPDAKAGRDGNRTLGSLYDLMTAAKDKKVNPIGEWNTARIVIKGSHVEHWLNGKKILEFERGSQSFRTLVKQSKYNTIPGFGEWADGHILLQEHGSRVAYRNIKVRVLK